jgi:hypothetical protein
MNYGITFIVEGELQYVTAVQTNTGLYDFEYTILPYIEPSYQLPNTRYSPNRVSINHPGVFTVSYKEETILKNIICQWKCYKNLEYDGSIETNEDFKNVIKDATPIFSGFDKELNFIKFTDDSSSTNNPEAYDFTIKDGDELYIYANGVEDTGIILNNSSLTIGFDQITTITATTAISRDATKIEWTSLDSSVVEIVDVSSTKTTSTVTIKGKMAGKAKVKAFIDDDCYAFCEVTVTKGLPIIQNISTRKVSIDTLEVKFQVLNLNASERNMCQIVSSDGSKIYRTETIILGENFCECSVTVTDLNQYMGYQAKIKITTSENGIVISDTFILSLIPVVIDSITYTEQKNYNANIKLTFMNLHIGSKYYLCAVDSSDSIQRFAPFEANSTSETVSCVINFNGVGTYSRKFWLILYEPGTGYDNNVMFQSSFFQFKITGKVSTPDPWEWKQEYELSDGKKGTICSTAYIPVSDGVLHPVTALEWNDFISKVNEVRDWAKDNGKTVSGSNLSTVSVDGDFATAYKAAVTAIQNISGYKGSLPTTYPVILNAQLFIDLADALNAFLE